MPAATLVNRSPLDRRGRGEAFATLLALVELAKPGVTRLVLVTAWCGAVIAPGPVALTRLIVALVSLALVVAAANALNMFLERDVDAKMERTRSRPLPSGRLSPKVALWFGLALATTGLISLFAFVNKESALLTAAAFASYVCLYTPLKRVTPLALYVGAIPGAIPPLIGWASMTGTVSFQALSLFAILFVWQLPHFLAIAIFRQSEYERAGLRVLPSVKGLLTTKRTIMAYIVLLFAVSLLPAVAGLAGPGYVALAVLLGIVFYVWGLSGLSQQAGPGWARSLFFASLPYLVLVFAALVLSAP